MHYNETTTERSVFTKILEWEIAWVILVTSERFFTILTNRPTHPGHTLLIPKRCGVQFSDFTPDELLEYALLKQLIIRSLESTYCTAINWKKIWEHVSWFEIKNHYHEHFIPAERWEQVTLQWSHEASIEERRIEAQKIIVTLHSLKEQYSTIENLVVSKL
jgi:diadenosine tetraphosphate (Ap4A) HIT family hydrolase